MTSLSMITVVKILPRNTRARSTLRRLEKLYMSGGWKGRVRAPAINISDYSYPAKVLPMSTRA